MKNSCRSGWETLEGHPSPENDFANLPLKLQLFYNKDLILRWHSLYDKLLNVIATRDGHAPKFADAHICIFRAVRVLNTNCFEMPAPAMGRVLCTKASRKYFFFCLIIFPVSNKSTKIFEDLPCIHIITFPYHLNNLYIFVEQIAKKQTCFISRLRVARFFLLRSL